MTIQATAAAPRPSLAARFGASPAQVVALAFVALFLIAFLIVPLLRVIVAAFTGPDGFTLVHFGDFLNTGKYRQYTRDFVARLPGLALQLALVDATFNPIARFLKDLMTTK